MSTTHSVRLGLPYLAAGQLQKHVTVNEALTRLDTIAQIAVVSRTLAAQPASPTDGDLYILPGGAAGPAWSSFSAGDLLRAEIGVWTRIVTPVGALVMVLDTGVLVTRHADGWDEVRPAVSELQNLSRLGLGTTADAGNPFAARLNKALWTSVPTTEGGDGDLRLTLNKTGVADVLSLLFQSDFSGRAELGLVGDDNLTLKVSPDGSMWREALKIDAAEARVSFPLGAGRAEVFLIAASGTFSLPAWARTVSVTAVGAGGGGGTGTFGTTGTRPGGGGGGAGGLSEARWRVEDLPGELALSVGAGGAAGAAGGDTTVSDAGQVILTARGGGAGGAGAAGGSGGPGGSGFGPGNAGGASSTVTTASTGESLTRPQGPGGGGGGGGRDATGVARSGGGGGVGGANNRPAAGGSGGAAAAGTSGSASGASVLSPSGGGGGGGGAVTSGAGSAGGAGGGFGAGGGGGGAGLTVGGIGGIGAPGVVLIVAEG